MEGKAALAGLRTRGCGSQDFRKRQSPPLCQQLFPGEGQAEALEPLHARSLPACQALPTHAALRQSRASMAVTLHQISPRELSSPSAAVGQWDRGVTVSQGRGAEGPRVG